MIVYAADIHDGTKAHLLVEYCLGYLDRMQKILVDDAYKKVFYDWVYNNVVGLEVEFASRLHQIKALFLSNGGELMKELLGG